MKRFAVLFGILAIAFACGTSYATAPQAGDVPDIRLNSGDGLSSLPLSATDAYDVFDYFKDVDDAPSALTVSIRNIQLILGTLPAPNIDIGGATEVSGVSQALVDVYGHATAGWAEYAVRVDDASTVSKGAVGADAISDTAVAKYSTFAVMEPTIEDGVFLKTGGETGQTRQFVYCYVGQALGELYRLDVAVDPASASHSVDWEVYVSDVIYDSTADNYDANGSWIGLSKPHGASGPATSYDGLAYAIDANGTLTLTTSGSIGAGPWLVGLLATNQSDSNDMDGSRILTAKAMLAEATPDTATLGGSVTFDDLTPATIPAADDVYVVYSTGATNGAVTYVSGSNPSQTDTIAPNCAWQYKMGGTDSFLDSVPLEVVDLSADTDLPGAAQIVEDQTTAHIAGGNAIKATMAPPSGPTAQRRSATDTSEQLQGFRLISRAFMGIQPTDIVTFSMSVATDAATTGDLPKYQIYLTSGWGGTIAGKDYRRIAGLVSSPWPQLDLPLDAEGWHTVSVTYAPGSTIQWFNLNGDTAMDEADLALLDTLAEPEGWEGRNELSVVKAGVSMSTTGQAGSTVNVWMDNMRVYRSAYALDLALGAEELSDSLASGENSTLDTLVGFGVSWFVSDIDGTMESLPTGSLTDTDLYNAGYAQGAGSGAAAAFYHDDMTYLDGTIANYATGIYDHTRNAGSSKSLNLTLSGDDGPDGPQGDLDAYRLHIQTGTVAGSGDGLYCVEAYVSKLNACNQVAAYRHPEFRLLLQEVAPNVLGTAGGMIYVNGGMPEAVTGDPPYNWQRVVGTMYIPNCEALRGDIYMMDAFKADVNNFQVPFYVDDLNLYKIEDPTIFFDADLFDGV